MKRKSLIKPATAAIFSLAALFSLVAADAAAPPATPPGMENVKTVPGELWKQSVSVSMEGFSMPARSTDVCVPKTSTQQDLYKSDKNCSVYDVQNSGNSFSAKMRCTGADAMEGTIQSTQEGNRTRGKATMRSLKKGEEGSMEMTFDSTRTGQACQAMDASSIKPKQVERPKGMDVDAFCRKLVADGKKDGNPLGVPGNLVWGKEAPCAKPEFQKAYCSAVQSHAGFLSIDVGERKMNELMKMQGETTAARADDFQMKPLTASMNACGLSRSQTDVDALRTKLLGTAETQDANEYLIYYGGDAEFAKAREVGKRECSGSAYTSSRNPKYAGYCNSLGLALALNNRKGAIAIIDGSCQGEGCGSAGAERSATGTSKAASSAGNKSGAQPGAAPVDTKEASKEAAKEAAKEAVDKGKRLLRGLLGGG